MVQKIIAEEKSTQMNFTELIKFTNDSASIEFNYNGSTDQGMIAWLDSNEMKLWWKANGVIIEPYPGGVFYIEWKEKNTGKQHAIYGVMELIDVEQCAINISKIMYVYPGGKLGQLRLLIKFDTINATESRLKLIHQHKYSGQQLQIYNSLVLISWPKTFVMLKRYLEK